MEPMYYIDLDVQGVEGDDFAQTQARSRRITENDPSA